MANNAHETVATQSNHGHVQLTRLRLRTCHWTQKLNNCRQRARDSPRRESHSHGPKLAAAQAANHRLRRQHSTAHSCTFHHASCNSRFTYCTLSFGNRSSRIKITWVSAFLIGPHASSHVTYIDFANSNCGARQYFTKTKKHDPVKRMLNLKTTQ